MVHHTPNPFLSSGIPLDSGGFPKWFVWLGKGELVAWRGGWGMGREHNFPGRVSAPPQGHHSQGT